MRLARQKALAAALLTLSLTALSACGGSAGSTRAGASNTPAGTGAKVVDIYSSLPMRGPSAGDTLALTNGIRLALAQADGRAGRFTVEYTPLDDSVGATGWDAAQTAADARKAAADPRAVYYIGEFDDEASEVSMPILNEAGIAQVSPANTYAGLTIGQPGSASNLPPYAPTGTRTYLRIVPTESVQSAGILLAMKQAGCTKVALSTDQDPYGVRLAKLVELERSAYGIAEVRQADVALGGPKLAAYAQAIHRARPDCLLLTGVASGRVVQLTRDLHAAAPAARIFAPSEMCTSAWTNPRDGGVPGWIDPLIECVSVTRTLTAYPGGRSFLAAYRARYGVSDPSSYAILGYEAMKLALSTISGLGAHGDNKSAVLSALFSTTDRHSVLGTYGFDENGDTTLWALGLYKVGASGNPVFVRTITPHVL
jgi:branched-chain amino acid transport system substrate-binding protein